MCNVYTFVVPRWTLAVPDMLLAAFDALQIPRRGSDYTCKASFSSFVLQISIYLYMTGMALCLGNLLLSVYFYRKFPMQWASLYHWCFVLAITSTVRESGLNDFAYWVTDNRQIPSMVQVSKRWYHKIQEEMGHVRIYSSWMSSTLGEQLNSERYWKVFLA